MIVYLACVTDEEENDTLVIFRNESDAIDWVNKGLKDLIKNENLYIKKSHNSNFWYITGKDGSRHYGYGYIYAKEVR